MVTVTRRSAALLLLTLVLAGCANNTGTIPVGAASDRVSAPVSIPASPASNGEPTASGTQTISGTVAEGVEPNCLVLKDSSGSHVLFFNDPALRSAAKVGARVTLVGSPEPRMMTTCQQGVPFVVSTVEPPQGGK